MVMFVKNALPSRSSTRIGAVVSRERILA